MLQTLQTFAYRLLQSARDSLGQETTRWVLWIPCGFGSGVMLYFSCIQEPSWPIIFVLAGLILGGGLFLRRWWVFFLIIGVVMAGFMRAMHIAHPLPTFWEKPLSTKQETEKDVCIVPGEMVTLTGMITSLEHQFFETKSSRYRVVLQDVGVVRKGNKSPLTLPFKVWITAPRSPNPAHLLQEGDSVRVRLRLYPIPGPEGPYAYHPRFWAFFQGIGAKGHSFFPLTVQKPTSYPASFSNIRHRFTRLLYTKAMRHDAKAVTAALVTGDKGGLSRALRKEFAAAGIAHLLSISGLHVSIVGAIFAYGVRWILARIPGLALRINIQSVAGSIGIVVAGAYTCFSGLALPSQRAFIMAFLGIIGLVLHRSIGAVRSISCAAMLLLWVDPVSILSPGFQLSFAAVAGLIIGSALCKALGIFVSRREGLLLHIRTAVLQGIVTDAVVVLAILPYELYTFGQINVYGAFTNILCIPYATCVVMPMLIGTCTLSFLHMDCIGMWRALDHIIGALLAGASFISSLPGATIFTPPWGKVSMTLATFGGLWMLLWQQRMRWLGAYGVLGGALIPAFIPQPSRIALVSRGNIGIVDKGRGILWTKGKCGYSWLRITGMKIHKPILSLRNPWYIHEQTLWGTFDGFTAKLTPSIKPSFLCIEGLGKGRAAVRLDTMHHDYCAVSMKNTHVYTTCSPLARRPWDRQAHFCKVNKRAVHPIQASNAN